MSIATTAPQRSQGMSCSRSLPWVPEGATEERPSRRLQESHAPSVGERRPRNLADALSLQ